jgi:hypothetical protein
LIIFTIFLGHQNPGSDDDDDDDWHKRMKYDTVLNVLTGRSKLSP